MLAKLSNIVARPDLSPRVNLDLEPLVKSIREDGLRDPIKVELIIDQKTCYGCMFQVIDGLRRVLACQELGLEKMEVEIAEITFVNPDDDL